LHAEFGNWSQAAGAYHSRTPHFNARYRARFDRIHAGLAGTPLEVAALEAPPGEAAAPATPKRSRTRMARRPLILTVARTPAPVEAGPARSVRVQRGAATSDDLPRSAATPALPALAEADSGGFVPASGVH
jgi:hypothetical protein